MSDTESPDTTASNVGDKVKGFFTSLDRRKSSASEQPQASSEAPMLHAAAEKEPIVATVETAPKSEITNVAPEETPSVTVLSSDSFRADDILRSKLSTEESFPLPTLLQSLPSKLPPEKETPTTLKPPNLPQILPPAFSPVVSLKHITPFEHAEKPMFRARQSSAPPPRVESKTRRSPSPASQNTPPERLKKQEEKKISNSMSQSYYPHSTYSWDSWERPQFHRVPGCLPFSDGVLLENRGMNGYPPSKNGNMEQPQPPPTLYYDSNTGQYIPGPDYRTLGRYATTGNRRHRSRRHHQNHRSVGNYSTYDHTRSASLISSRTPEPPYPVMDQGYRGHVQLQQPIMYPYVIQARPPIMPTSPRVQQTYQPMEESMHQTYNDRKHLVSSGTDDSPMQVVETIGGTPRRPNNIHSVNVAPVNTAYVETIPPVFIPQTVVYRNIAQPPQPPAPVKLGQEEQPIRYTSDVVRSINRQAFKIGQKGVREGELSPRDHYLEVISNGAPKPTMRERTEYPGGRLNDGGERRLSVKDLVKKFSIQSDDDVFVRNPRNDFNNKEESRNGNYVEDGVYHLRR
ncbi:hypothetical protein ACTXT7_008614 [Hymenolepis weldensis]